MKISYTEVPVEDGTKTKPLNETMWLTRSNWKTVNWSWGKMHHLVNSSYRQISPYQFADGVKIAENWSNDEQECIIFDIDDGLSIESATELFGEYRFLIYTTKSHQKEKGGKVCDRFRIIFPAINIPRGDEYWEMVSELEREYCFIDKQVNTKTGAFLCNYGGEIFYNEGNDFDCSIFTERVARRKQFELAKKNIEPERKAEFTDDIDTARLKSRLDREAVKDILMGIGYDIRGHKFKLREERTPSTNIRADGYIKDFGSGWGGDLIQLLIDYQGMTFKEAVTYIEGRI